MSLPQPAVGGTTKEPTSSPSGGIAVPATRAEPIDPSPIEENLTVHDVLGQIPALIAVTYGPEHCIGYVNEAYVGVFGSRQPGVPAQQALPELAELGLLPLMDQVYRSGRPRTVTARRIAYTGSGVGPPRHGYFSFACVPIRADGGEPAGPGPTPSQPGVCDPSHSQPAGLPHSHAPVLALALGRRAARRRAALSAALRGEVRGGLVFAADVTDQVQATERLRESERRHREAAVALQRSLLPQKLEQPDDLRVAATYQPGGVDAAVGGDWYDVITLGGGRTALVLGDVMGRGVRAAAVMGQLRTAVRAYARLDLPPHEVLQLLDGLATEIDPSQISTCVYAVYDPNDNQLTYASAGHLPILVRDADGTTRRGEEQSGPPLGTGGWLHTSGTIEFGPGTTAVLYTDGLVERRGQDIDEGIDALERALPGATGTPKVICDRLLRSLGVTAEHDDDVAVLVLQHPARQGPEAALFRNASLDLLGGVAAASRARAFASGVLASWRFPDDLRELGVLAASELVANSLQHGAPPMRLRLRRTDRRLTIEVTDGDEHLPRRLRVKPVDESGWGISIVATIASAWGARRTPGGGKAVWCEFALPRRDLPGRQPSDPS